MHLYRSPKFHKVFHGSALSTPSLVLYTDILQALLKHLPFMIILWPLPHQTSWTHSSRLYLNTCITPLKSAFSTARSEWLVGTPTIHLRTYYKQGPILPSAWVNSWRGFRGLVRVKVAPVRIKRISVLPVWNWLNTILLQDLKSATSPNHLHWWNF